MEYALEIGSVSLIYMLNLIKICSGIQKLVWRIRKHTDNIVIS
jgi:hypothetical protein